MDSDNHVSLKIRPGLFFLSPKQAQGFIFGGCLTCLTQDCHRQVSHTLTAVAQVFDFCSCFSRMPCGASHQCRHLQYATWSVGLIVVVPLLAGGRMACRAMWLVMPMLSLIAGGHMAHPAGAASRRRTQAATHQVSGHGRLGCSGKQVLGAWGSSTLPPSLPQVGFYCMSHTKLGLIWEVQLVFGTHIKLKLGPIFGIDLTFGETR